jgi:hypothetical protein
MVGAFRKLKMERDLPVQELLAKKGEELPPFPAAGIGIHNDFNFSGDPLKQRFAPAPLNSTLSHIIFDGFVKKLQMQGAQKLGEGAGYPHPPTPFPKLQRRRWTFYGAIIFPIRLLAV